MTRHPTWPPTSPRSTSPAPNNPPRPIALGFATAGRGAGAIAAAIEHGWAGRKRRADAVIWGPTGEAELLVRTRDTGTLPLVGGAPVPYVLHAPVAQSPWELEIPTALWTLFTARKAARIVMAAVGHFLGLPYRTWPLHPGVMLPAAANFSDEPAPFRQPSSAELTKALRNLAAARAGKRLPYSGRLSSAGTFVDPMGLLSSLGAPR